MKIIIYYFSTIILILLLLFSIDLCARLNKRKLKKSIYFIPKKLFIIGFNVTLFIIIPINGFRELIVGIQENNKQEQEYISEYDEDRPEIYFEGEYGPGESYPDYSDPERYHLIKTGEANYHLRSNPDIFESNNISSSNPFE
ncbi:hypothetical protein FZW96_12000 [Bacillus sp. BGMRC 2118]|nr:hypothetical protein FZW96_12000 [Bacillus sp. BGMRC 2118]